MKRYLDDFVADDLQRKLVFLTGPRQVGKTTLSTQLGLTTRPFQYLNYDVAADRLTIQRQSWSPDSKLLVLDELHKMSDWKPWLKGVIDSQASSVASLKNTSVKKQQILVTGSARMDTFRQSGESLAGRFLSWRLHPFSIKELADQNFTGSLAGSSTSAGASNQINKPLDHDALLTHLMLHGGFPEPCLSLSTENAERWRDQYTKGLIREDILEFSRLHEVNTMRILLDLLRERVGSPLSLASLARDLNVSQPTVKRFIDILQALFIVFVVQPWHFNIARSILQAPKIYFYDTGMIRGEGTEIDGLRFENAAACMLLKHVHFLQDGKAKAVDLHYLRNKEGNEIDFALSENQSLTHMIECKWNDSTPHKAFTKFIPYWPKAKAVQLVRHLRNKELRNGVSIEQAAPWLASLSA